MNVTFCKCLMNNVMKKVSFRKTFKWIAITFPWRALYWCEIPELYIAGGWVCTLCECPAPVPSMSISCQPLSQTKLGGLWLKWPFNVFMYYTKNQTVIFAKLLPSLFLFPASSQHSQSAFHRFSFQNFFILNHCQIKIRLTGSAISECNKQVA